MMKRIKVQGRWIGGKNDPCFIVAEAGINHNGNFKIAQRMIDAAVESGADAVKFQAFQVDELIADKKEIFIYKSQGKKVSEAAYEMFKRHELSDSDFKKILVYGKKKGIICFATPQNVSDLKMLLRIGVSLIKIGSDDLTNLPLIKEYASQKLPLIISAGMADLKEIKDAVKTILKTGNNKLIILHCVSLYPAKPEEANLRKIETIKKNFKTVVGFSDHTDGILTAIAAVALGAKIIEKHFTLDKNMPGPDHHFSADPKELKDLVRGIRYIEKTMGSSTVKPTEREKEIKKHARRSIVASQNIKEGEIFSKKNIVVLRPGNGKRGLGPKYYEILMGQRATNNIGQYQSIGWDDVFQNKR